MGAAAAAKRSDGEVFLPWGAVVLALLAGWSGSALFTILDYALFALDDDEIDDLGLAKPRAGLALRNLRRDLDRSWLTLLSGSLLFNLLFAAAVGALILNLSPFLASSAPLAAVLISGVAVLLLGETTPGLLAARWLKTLAPAAAQGIRIAAILLLPLYGLPLLLIRQLGRLRDQPIAERSRALEAEKRLLVLVGVGQVDVSLEEEEREMIDHAFEFGDRTAAQVMTPRSQIAGVPSCASQQDVLALMRKTPYSRLLVYTRSLDNVDGILSAKQVLLDPATDYHKRIAPAVFVPEAMSLVDLVALMKRERRQMVVVLDDYGATAGIVSMNDLLEELVGRNGGERAPKDNSRPREPQSGAAEQGAAPPRSAL